MPRLNDTDKLAALQEKMRQLKAQEDALISRNREKERKDDTRRKILAGALALEHAEKNAASDFGKTLHRLLDEYVTRSADRALFPALPPRAKDDNGIREAAREVARNDA